MKPAQPLPILQNGDSLLRAVAEPVPGELFGAEELKHMIDQMAATLDQEADGVALAAPQVGMSFRIFIVRYDRTRPPEEIPSADGDTAKAKFVHRDPELGVFINPEF